MCDDGKATACINGNGKRIRSWVLFAAGLAVTVLAGRWAQGLYSQSEFVHFCVNFPTVPGAETLTRDELGGPWARIPDDKWEGYPPGGLLAWGREGAIVVDLGRQGFVKRLIQPNDVTLSTHWLRNVGTRPYRIRLELDMCGMPLEWETFERHWDDQAKESSRDIHPRARFNMDWHITIPPELRDAELICDGGLRVIDAHADELLTFLPIRIIDSGKGPNGDR